MENNNLHSNTMELNSILEEAKRSRNEEKTEIKADSSAKSKQSEDIGDNYVIIDDEKEFTDIEEFSKKSKKDKEKKAKATDKKKKKLTLLIIGGVLLLLILGGVCFYIFSGSNTFAQNVYVNGISLAGMNKADAKKLLEKEEQKLADSINIDVTADKKTVKLTKQDFKYTFNTDSILDEALEYSKEKGLKTGEKEYTITLTLDPQSCSTASEKVSKEIDTKAKNATVTDCDFSDNSFTIEEGTNGVQVKKEDLTKALQDFTKAGTLSGKINAASDVVEPKYSKKYLTDNIKKLSSFTTTSTNNSNGNSNMRVSLDACNKSIINPDDVWSFNECTGDSNKESNGYKPAGVINNGKFETGVGGGICQSSTTIYNAAIRCGMEVVERSCHYYQSTYVDAGLDATIDYGNIDLKLKNIFDYQLMMNCYMDGVTLHCDIYGLENPEFDKITVSSSVTSHFSNGFKAQTSRTYYKGDKEIKTEQLPNSTYYTSAPGGNSGGGSGDNDDDDDDSSSESSDEPSSSSSPEPKPTPTEAPQPVPTEAPQPTPTEAPAPQPDAQVQE